jgi:hypothetical protein
MCIHCGKSRLFLEMIEEVIMVSIAQSVERVPVEHEKRDRNPLGTPTKTNAGPGLGEVEWRNTLPRKGQTCHRLSVDGDC